MHLKSKQPKKKVYRIKAFALLTKSLSNGGILEQQKTKKEYNLTSNSRLFSIHKKIRSFKI